MTTMDEKFHFILNSREDYASFLKCFSYYKIIEISTTFLTLFCQTVYTPMYLGCCDNIFLPLSVIYPNNTLFTSHTG